MSQLFRQESLDQLGAQERESRYVDAMKPVTWILLLAAFLIVASFMVWGFTGWLPVGVTGKGYSVEMNDDCYLFIEPQIFINSGIIVGDTVYLTLPDGQNLQGEVTFISDEPKSADEIEQTTTCNPWIISQVLEKSIYCYVIKVEAEKIMPSNLLLEGTIVVEKVHPIQYLF